MNPQDLLEQFLGSNVGQTSTGAMGTAKEKLNNSGMAGVVGGLAAGGLLGVMLGNKKVRKKSLKKAGKVAGGAVKYGGAAALGALAYRAYQDHQAGKWPQPTPAAVPTVSPAPNLEFAPPPPAGSKFLPANGLAQNGKPFELALVMAMIAAANADGHIDGNEQRRIFEQVNQLPLDAEDKAFVFDSLRSPPSLGDIAALADGLEQASELYLVSRLAIDPDHPAEQAYLEGLAARLTLPPDLVGHLNAQAAAAEV